MNESAKPDKRATSLSEEVLRQIYGDDYQGCNIHPEVIASLIQEGLKADRKEAADLIELYEKVVEAVHLLSTAPDSKAVSDPNELRNLLSQRLDAIHAVTTRTMETTARLHKGSSASTD